MISCFDHIRLPLWAPALQAFPLWCFWISHLLISSHWDTHLASYILPKTQNHVPHLHKPCLQLTHFSVLYTVFDLFLWSFHLLALSTTAIRRLACSSSFGSVVPEQPVDCFWHPLSSLVFHHCLRGRENLVCNDYLAGNFPP